jgi:hypothetical protein
MAARRARRALRPSLPYQARILLILGAAAATPTAL